jgi:SPP1 gp7 family putative phage head morphogenesis protein
MNQLAIALRVQAAQTQKRIKLRKAPRPRWPHKERLEYYRELLAMVEGVQAVVRRMVLPELARIVAAVNITRPEDEPIRTDAPGDAIEDLFAEAAGEAQAAVPVRMIEMAAQRNAVRVALFQGNELQRQVQHVAKINVWADTTGLAEHLELAVGQNVKLITSLAHGQLDEIKDVVVRGARAGVHQSVIAEQIEQRFAMTKKRAALIANDQVGKLNGELNQIRQQRLGVRRYRWSSSQDERVRPRHRKLNGTIQEWRKPPLTDERTGEHAHPGQPIRCRCQPIPIIDDVLADAGLLDPADVELEMPSAGPQKDFKPLPPPLKRDPANKRQGTGEAKAARAAQRAATEKARAEAQAAAEREAAAIKARAEAEARAAAERAAAERAAAAEKAAAEARAAAEAKARAEAEARARAEEARLEAERQARIKARAETLAKVQAEAKARAEAEALAKAEAEAKAKAAAAAAKKAERAAKAKATRERNKAAKAAAGTGAGGAAPTSGRLKEHTPEHWIDHYTSKKKNGVANYGEAARSMAYGRAMEERGATMSLEEYQAAAKRLDDAGLLRGAESYTRTQIDEGHKTVADAIRHYEAEAKKAKAGSGARVVAQDKAASLRAVSSLSAHIEELGTATVKADFGKARTVGEISSRQLQHVHWAMEQQGRLYSAVTKNTVKFAHAALESQEIRAFESWERPNSYVFRAMSRDEYINDPLHRKWGFKAPRGYMDRSRRLIEYGELSAGRDAILETGLHEIGHMLEDFNPHMLQRSKAYVAARTEGIKNVQLNKLFPGAGYQSHEVAKPDKLFHPYMGKDYDGKATEMLSMTAERLNDHRRMTALVAQDADSYRFLLGQLGDY